MNEQEFRQTAIEYGYSLEEVQNFIDLHHESGIKLEDIILIQADDRMKKVIE